MQDRFFCSSLITYNIHSGLRYLCSAAATAYQKITYYPGRDEGSASTSAIESGSTLSYSIYTIPFWTAGLIVATLLREKLLFYVDIEDTSS